MLRVALVAGLTLSTLATAEARGFRLPFRGVGHGDLGHVHAASEPPVSPVSVGLAAGSFSRLGAKVLGPAPQAAKSIGDSQAQASAAPSPDAKPAAPARVAELPRPAAADAGHWCDDGKLVGTGKGFCVISRATD